MKFPVIPVSSGLIIQNNKVKSIKPFKRTQLRPCLFEYIYFSRPDSIFEGKNVYDVRKKIGHQLANENLSDKELVDVVIPIPDSGNASALGFSEKIKKNLNSALLEITTPVELLFKIQVQLDT